METETVAYLKAVKEIFAAPLVSLILSFVLLHSVGHARVSAILYRRKRDPEEIATTDDFVTIYESFKPLDSLDSHWAIYCVDRNYALLVELPQETTYYEAKRFPFCFLPFFDELHHRRLLVAQMLSLDGVSVCFSEPHVLTHLSIGWNEGYFSDEFVRKVIPSMLSLDGVSVCFSEPRVLTHLSIGWNKGYFSDEFVRQVLPSVFTYLRKDVPSNQLCVIKTASTVTRLVPLTSEISNVQHIFMFRRNGLASVEKLLLRDKAMDFMLKVYNWSPSLCNSFGWRLAGDGNFIRVLRPRDMLEWAAIVYGAPYHHYLKNKDSFSEFPVECIPAAMECTNFDSQDGTMLSRSVLSTIKRHD
uniref:DUF5672 domain-containing protein n=1 Tax=Steinernema glaseri TaxID=37863 RepID=A0A1I7Z0F5_9BILA